MEGKGGKRVMIFDMPLTEKEIAEVKELLEAKDHCKVIPQKSFNTIWFRGNNGETELRLNFLGNLKLIVSRVYFHNRRQGTMTAVLQLLDKYCKKYGIVKLCIQSVETKEMSDFCKKWDIKPDPYASFQVNGFMAGDHIKDIDLE